MCFRRVCAWVLLLSVILYIAYTEYTYRNYDIYDDIIISYGSTEEDPQNQNNGMTTKQTTDSDASTCEIFATACFFGLVGLSVICRLK